MLKNPVYPTLDLELNAVRRDGFISFQVHMHNEKKTEIKRERTVNKYYILFIII